MFKREGWKWSLVATGLWFLWEAIGHYQQVKQLNQDSGGMLMAFVSPWTGLVITIALLLWAKDYFPHATNPLHPAQPSLTPEALGKIHHAALLYELRKEPQASTPALRLDLNKSAGEKKRVLVPLANIGNPPFALPEGTLLGAIFNSQIRVELVSNAGGTPGIHIKAVNITGNPLLNVRMFVTDLRLWSDGLKKFVTTPEIHGPNAVFIELEIGNATLHPDVPEKLGFVRTELDRMELTGNAVGGGKDIRTNRRGIWRLYYRVGPKEGIGTNGSVCFEWTEGDNTSPRPCECPKEQKNPYESTHG